MKPAYIIAEIGSNCFVSDDDNKNFDNAARQIEAAKKAGADAVKFQYFTAEELWGPDCSNEPFAIKQRKYEMPKEWLPRLAKECETVGIDFLCTAFSEQGYEDVNPYVKMHKVASPEAVSQALVDVVERLGKKYMYSMGCITPSNYATTDFDRVIPMHCVSRYPADMLDYDLASLVRMGHYTDWGLSDHTHGSELACISRSLGARVFEKHVDFVCDVPEVYKLPDFRVSSSKCNFKIYVEDIRETKPRDHLAIDTESYEKYGRRENGFRPWPKGSDDNVQTSQVSGKSVDVAEADNSPSGRDSIR